jgi:hypothetical protein
VIVETLDLGKGSGAAGNACGVLPRGLHAVHNEHDGEQQELNGINPPADAECGQQVRTDQQDQHQAIPARSC